VDLLVSMLVPLLATMLVITLEFAYQLTQEYVIHHILVFTLAIVHLHMLVTSWVTTLVHSVETIAMTSLVITLVHSLVIMPVRRLVERHSTPQKHIPYTYGLLNRLYCGII